MLPEGLKVEMERAAARENLSLGELVRQAIQRYLLWRQERNSSDSLLNSRTVFRDEGPSDISVRHDDFLNRDGPHGKS